MCYFSTSLFHSYDFLINSRIRLFDFYCAYRAIDSAIPPSIAKAGEEAEGVIGQIHIQCLHICENIFVFRLFLEFILISFCSSSTHLIKEKHTRQLRIDYAKLQIHSELELITTSLS